MVVGLTFSLKNQSTTIRPTQDAVPVVHFLSPSNMMVRTGMCNERERERERERKERERERERERKKERELQMPALAM